VSICPRCQRKYDDTVRFCPVDGSLVMPGADTSMAMNIGRVLYGQFELRELAGRGATGTVWRAYQRSMDRIVAVKILHRDLARDPDVVRRFLREARAIAKIAHPNIVTVHLVGETDEGTPYLVMEHVDGISLETIVEAQGAQPLSRVVHLGRQIAAGLGEAHANGIVHRDLKPANLLVTDRGRVADQIKILDFGIAKLIHPGEEQSLLTRGQQVFGTPHYMAPEQATGEPVDARTDLYALGVVLFRLSTGQVPFDAPAGMQVVLRHIRDEAPKPSAINASILPALEDLILACLRKSPEDRPKDTDDVIAALDEISEHSPTRERHVVTPLVGSASADAITAVDHKPPPPPQPKRKRGSPAVTGTFSGSLERRETRPERHGLLALALLAIVGGVLYLSTRATSRPAIVETVDLGTAPADLALRIAEGPDRSAPDLAITLAAPTPDLATPPKRRHRVREEELPVTVFSAESTSPSPTPSPTPSPSPTPTP
jgi:serine/threonine protein kinase